MKFYQIKDATDIKVIRRYPQIGKIMEPDEDDYDVPNTMSKVNYMERLPDDLIVYPREVRHYARLTDHVSDIRSFYFTINEKLLKLIQESKMGDCQVFPTTVWYRKKEYDYFIFFIPEFHHEFIDYEKTNFYKTRISVGIEPVAINTMEEYFTMRAQLPMPFDIKAKDLVLKDDLTEVDLFRLKYVSRGYYISERLKNKLEEHKITGLQFVPVKEVRAIRGLNQK